MPTWSINGPKDVIAATPPLTTVKQYMRLRSCHSRSANTTFPQGSSSSSGQGAGWVSDISEKKSKSLSSIFQALQNRTAVPTVMTRHQSLRKQILISNNDLRVEEVEDISILTPQVSLLPRFVGVLGFLSGFRAQGFFRVFGLRVLRLKFLGFYGLWF